MADSPWRNRAGNQQCRPAGIDQPATEDELAAIVREAAAAGERVKVVGAGLVHGDRAH